MNNSRSKLADQIHRIIAQMLERRVKDPRLGFVTITDVRVTGDGREATVFYTDFGRSLDGREADAEGGVSDTAAALESAKGLLRTTIGRQLGLKFTPSLTFVADATQVEAQDMAALLAKVQEADAELAASRAGAQFAGEADPYRRPDEDEPSEDEPNEDEPNEDESPDPE